MKRSPKHIPGPIGEGSGRDIEDYFLELSEFDFCSAFCNADPIAVSLDLRLGCSGSRFGDVRCFLIGSILRFSLDAEPCCCSVLKAFKLNPIFLVCRSTFIIFTSNSSLIETISVGFSIRRSANSDTWINPCKIVIESIILSRFVYNCV